jgi:sporulation protein YlmC with PRC-barrel domain
MTKFVCKEEKTMKQISRIIYLLVFASLIVLFVCGGSGKQAEGNSASEIQKEPPAVKEMQVPISADKPRRLGMRASVSIANKLYNYEGEQLGQVHDLMMDLSSGYVTFIVFKMKVPGSGQSNFYPIPAGYLSFNVSRESFLIDFDQLDLLKNAPTVTGKIEPGEFVESGTDNLSIVTFWNNIGITPPPGPPRGPVVEEPTMYATGMRLLAGANVSFLGIEGYEIEDKGGKRLGKIDDLLYNPFTGKIYYLFVSFYGDTYGNDVYPIPLDAFTLNFLDRTITFDPDLDILVGAPRVAPGQWGKVRNPSWMDEVRSFWLHSDPFIALRQNMRIVPQTIVRESDLTGTEMTNWEGQSLGRIRDFVISDDGNVPYAIIEKGGRWYFIPTTVITLDQINNFAFVDISRENLSKLPGYDPSLLPDMNKPEWDKSILSFWLEMIGVKPEKTAFEMLVSRKAGAETNVQNFLASAIRGYDVRTEDGEKLGDIEDILLNVEEADIAYILLSVGGFLEIGEKIYPIPVSSVDIVTGKDVVLSVSKANVMHAPWFPHDKWPDMENPQWRRELRNYWNRF